MINKEITNLTNNSTVRKNVDALSRARGFGEIYSGMQNTFFGPNFGGPGSPVPNNRDNPGMVFITRPRLNLSYDNCLADRRFHPLLSDNEYSLRRMIRAVLDPISNRGLGDIEGASRVPGEILPGEGRSGEKVTSPAIDPKTPFIHLLGNNCLSMSGFPDISLDTYQSPDGVMREAWSMVDSSSQIYRNFDLTATFRNIAGDPVTILLQTLCDYQSNVYLGRMVPWPSNVVFNEMDYTLRIYRLILDPSMTQVQKIAAVPASFVTASPLGAAFNFDVTQWVSEDNAQISVPFRCMGIEYNDPILVEEFNMLVAAFNPDMAPVDDDDPETRIKGEYNAGPERLIKLNGRTKPLGKYRSYPRINPATMELEWYAPAYVFNDIVEYYSTPA